MATVPRFSRSAKVVTEVQPSYTPEAKAQAEMFGHIRDGFETGRKFLRPAVELEQTAKGEREAIAADEKGEFEMRRPFSIRDRAFNAAGERIITNRADLLLEDAYRDAMRKADGNMQRLEQELQAIPSAIGDLPKIPGLDTRMREKMERGHATARRQTTELAQRRAVAAAKQAAADAATNAKLELDRIALTAGTPDEISAAVAAGVDNLAQYGPREAFTLNGVEYPADDSRLGTLTPRQLETQAAALSNSAHELFLRADLERSDSPMQWAENFERSVFDGTSPLPPAESFSLLQNLQSRARADESARLRAEKAEADRIRLAVANEVNPYLTANENGVAVPVPPEVQAAAREAAAGNPTLAREVEIQLAAAEHISTLNSLSPTQRGAYIENVRNAAAADGRIDAAEAAVIDVLTPHLKAVNQAITRETVGVSAGEQLLASGALLDPAALDDMAAAAAGNPKVANAVEELRRAYDVIGRAEGMSGVEREELINRTEAALQEALQAGSNNGASVQLSLDALEQAEGYFKALEDKAKSNPVEFAQRVGVPMAPFPTDPEAGLEDIVGVIVGRTAALAPVAEDYGNPTPVPLSGPEAAAMTEWMREARGSTRVAMVEGLYQGLPRAQADAIVNSLGVAEPAVAASARVRTSAPVASATIMNGLGVSVKHPPNAREETEVQLAPFLGQFSPAGRDRLMESAKAYAVGRAAMDGNTETLVDDWETGLDLALGADDKGVGGIENVRGFGMAILPTGVSGRDVSRGLKRMDDMQLMEIAGGTVESRLGDVYTADQLRDTIEGFQLDPASPGNIMPLDADGRVFMVSRHGQLQPLSFSVKELTGG